VNRTGGVGSLAYIKARQGQIEKVFAILLVIILIGFIQDRLFAFLDKNLFPHKTYKSFTSGIKEARFGIYGILITLVLAALCASLGLFPNTLAKGEGISMLTQGFLVLGISAVLFAFYGQYNISKSTTNA